MLSDWEREITAKNTERILSIVFQLNNFEKSVADEIGYSQEFQVEKTGKEIKEKLQAELITATTEKTALLTKMERLVEEIGSSPIGKGTRWLTRGYEKYLSSIPLQYTYTQIYPGRQESEGCYPDDSAPISLYGVDPVVSKDVADKMRSYNEASEDYLRRCVDEIKLKTVIDNLPDGKKIKLNPQLASQLGF